MQRVSPSRLKFGPWPPHGHPANAWNAEPSWLPSFGCYPELLTTTNDGSKVLISKNRPAPTFRNKQLSDHLIRKPAILYCKRLAIEHLPHAFIDCVNWCTVCVCVCVYVDCPLHSMSNYPRPNLPDLLSDKSKTNYMQRPRCRLCRVFANDQRGKSVSRP